MKPLHGVGSATVRRAEKYPRGIDAAEEAVPGAQEEILTGHIKAMDGQIVALAAGGDRYYQRNLQTQRTPKARLAAEPINKAPRSTYAFLLRPETVRFRGSVERGAFCVT